MEGSGEVTATHIDNAVPLICYVPGSGYIKTPGVWLVSESERVMVLFAEAFPDTIYFFAELTEDI